MDANAIGLMAASLTTASFVPQAIRVVRTRDTQAISLGMYLLFTAGIMLWMLYGILLRSVPIMIANGITIPLVLVILFMKLREPSCAARAKE